MVHEHLTRRHDWRARLAAYLAAERSQSFAWGQHDCALGLAAGAVNAITGEDVARAWRGRYTSPIGAVRALKSAGQSSLGDLVATILPELASPLHARPGDLGLIDASGPIGEALCVVDVSTLIVLTEAGHGNRPKTDLLRAFKVGD